MDSHIPPIKDAMTIMVSSPRKSVVQVSIIYLSAVIQQSSKILYLFQCPSLNFTIFSAIEISKCDVGHELDGIVSKTLAICFA